MERGHPCSHERVARKRWVLSAVRRAMFIALADQLVFGAPLGATYHFAPNGAPSKLSVDCYKHRAPNRAREATNVAAPSSPHACSVFLKYKSERLVD